MGSDSLREHMKKRKSNKPELFNAVVIANPEVVESNRQIAQDLEISCNTVSQILD